MQNNNFYVNPRNEVICKSDGFALCFLIEPWNLSPPILAGSHGQLVGSSLSPRKIK